MPNVENIQKVIDLFLELPDERIQMDNFWSVKLPITSVPQEHQCWRQVERTEFERLYNRADCKTAACLAGWVVHLFPNDPFSDPLRLVEHVFGISTYQALGLCYSENWYYIQGGKEFKDAKDLIAKGESERQILITLLSWIRDGNFRFSSRPQRINSFNLE